MSGCFQVPYATVNPKRLNRVSIQPQAAADLPVVSFVAEKHAQDLKQANPATKKHKMNPALERGFQTKGEKIDEYRPNLGPILTHSETN